MLSYFPVFAATVAFAGSFFLRSTSAKPRPVEVQDDYDELEGRQK